LSLLFVLLFLRVFVSSVPDLVDLPATCDKFIFDDNLLESLTSRRLRCLSRRLSRVILSRYFFASKASERICLCRLQHLHEEAVFGIAITPFGHPSCNPSEAPRKPAWSEACRIALQSNKHAAYQSSSTSASSCRVQKASDLAGPCIYNDTPKIVEALSPRP
jgi:hypothetical protein